MVLLMSTMAIAFTMPGHFQELMSWQIDTEGKGTSEITRKLTDVTMGALFQDVIAVLLK